MEASPLALELTVLSCRDLKAFNFFQKLTLYAAVSIVSDPANQSTNQQQRQKTPVDRVGNRNPEWTHALSFDLRPYASSLGDGKFLQDVIVRFEVRCEGTVLGNRTVGETKVPLSDLLKEFQGARRFLSYQVKSGKGRANGVLNFSYQVNGKPMKTATTEHQNFAAVSPSPRCPSLEVVQKEPKEISYPSIDIDDARSPSTLFPPLLSQHTTPYNNVFYVPSNNRQDVCNCYKPYAPAPVPGHVPRQYPSKMEVTGYGYCYGVQNQFRI